MPAPVAGLILYNLQQCLCFVCWAGVQWLQWASAVGCRAVPSAHWSPSQLFLAFTLAKFGASLRSASQIHHISALSRLDFWPRPPAANISLLTTPTHGTFAVVTFYPRPSATPIHGTLEVVKLCPRPLATADHASQNSAASLMARSVYFCLDSN